MFTSRRLDTETGLYYYRARMYDPTIGRFLQRDPLGYYDSMNLYAYVKNNPINKIDPTGKQTVEIITTVITIVGVCGAVYFYVVQVIIPLFNDDEDLTVEQVVEHGLETLPQPPVIDFPPIQTEENIKEENNGQEQ